MVYVYAKQSELNKYIGKKLSVEEIKDTLADLGMDIKGESEGGDPELKIEITAEKMDMVSAVGIGRAIKYYKGIEREIPKYSIKKSGLKLVVEKSAAKSRPKCVAAIVRNVPMNQEFLDEIIKIQEKIHDSFGRGRKKGAIGIYPLDKIEFPITYGAEEPEGIVFRPLEFDKDISGREILQLHDAGKKFAHLLAGCDLFPVFRDNTGKVLSMPPIINSHDTGRVEVTNKDLFIECSGYNLHHLDNILKVLVTTFIDMGASAQSIEVNYEGAEDYELDLKNYFDEINLDDVNRLIGVDIKPEEIEALLNKMMYGMLEVNDGWIGIEVPVFKSDVWHDVDIADDIARAYGYNNIVPTFPSVSSVGEHLEFSVFRERISELMVRLGFLEVYTYMLTSSQDQFKKMGLDESKNEHIKLIDSADQGINMVRTLILPDNLSSLHINRKNKYPQKIFENGFTIQVDEKADTGARNEVHLSVSIADPKSNYTQIKGVLDTIMKLNEIEFNIVESDLSFLIEGRRANILVKGKNIGFIGELHPEILTNFGLLVPVSCLELNLEKLFELIK